jgi:hypothetical protein
MPLAHPRSVTYLWDVIELDGDQLAARAAAQVR